MPNILRNSDLQYIAGQAMDMLLKNKENGINEYLTNGNINLSKSWVLECSIAFLKAYQQYASKSVKKEDSLLDSLLGNVSKYMEYLPFDNPMSMISKVFSLENRVDDTHKLLTRKCSSLALEAAYIAKHVYGNKYVSLIGGWKQVNRPIRNVIYADETGLVSALYQRINETGDDEYIYAFAGTDITNVEDLKTDVLQNWIDTPQYNNALKNARLVSDFVGEHKLTFVGHSLGGGEAAYCAINIPKRSAVTFNPMGVASDNDLDTNVDSYIMVNDWLNMIQDTNIIPQANGIKHYIQDDNIMFIESHDMDSVINALKKLR